MRRDRELLPQIEGIGEIREEAERERLEARGERKREVEAMLAKIEVIDGFLGEVLDLVNGFLGLSKDTLATRVKAIREVTASKRLA